MIVLRRASVAGSDILGGMSDDPELVRIAAEILHSISADFPERQGRGFAEVLLKIVERGLYTACPPRDNGWTFASNFNAALAAMGRRHRSDTIWQLCKVRFIEPAEPEPPRSVH